jgi:hypothetical protein
LRPASQGIESIIARPPLATRRFQRGGGAHSFRAAETPQEARG